MQSTGTQVGTATIGASDTTKQMSITIPASFSADDTVIIEYDTGGNYIQCLDVTKNAVGNTAGSGSTSTTGISKGTAAVVTGNSVTTGDASVAQASFGIVLMIVVAAFLF
eukprot:TRINITY_DN70_c0_g1_i6.p1 TRINITY_DN70_c0_g1~~TRINITY_DN70_c0_g1_i6.p1  ORF type:complete len:110 (+),score=19.98 TRINITY_DN70_c0_g1_i6:259-588(+)